MNRQTFHSPSAQSYPDDDVAEDDEDDGEAIETIRVNVRKLGDVMENNPGLLDDLKKCCLESQSILDIWIKEWKRLVFVKYPDLIDILKVTYLILLFSVAH